MPFLFSFKYFHYLLSPQTQLSAWLITDCPLDMLHHLMALIEDDDADCVKYLHQSMDLQMKWLEMSESSSVTSSFYE